MTSDVSAPPPERAADLEAAGALLGMLLEAHAKDGEGRIRVEDLLSAGAAICGEACLAAIGEIDPDDHQLTPGSALFSDAMNAFLNGNAQDWEAAGTSVFGVIRSGALDNGYMAEDFPAVREPMASYAASLGNGDLQATWGRVPLGVPEANLPRVEPLRAAFELRGDVEVLRQARKISVAEWPIACAHALVVELGRVRQAIAPGVAIRLVLETVNGMAKMAPMTTHHMEIVAKGSAP